MAAEAFVTGGAVPLDSAAYIERQFEVECFGKLTGGRWVLLLGPRQHGKTSALVRLRSRLTDAGFRVALIDMQRYAGSDDYATFVRWFTLAITTALAVPFNEPTASTGDDVEAWLASGLSGIGGSVAILVDEAVAVPEPLRVRFFSQLRALHNSRAMVGQTEWQRRTSFLFAGTFRPEGVIAGDNSPFNVSETVYTGDLSLDDARTLARTSAVADDLLPIVEKAYAVVGGQPYLLQRVLDVTSAGPDSATRERLYVQVLDDFRQGRDRHVPALLERVSADPAASDVVREIAIRSDGVEHALSAPYDFLPVLGIARIDNSRLLIRNELYRQAVISSPQFTPASASATSALGTLSHLPSSRFASVADPTFQNVILEAYTFGVDAANAGHLRYALVGFGACYEGLLLDFLSNRLSQSDLAAAMSGVRVNGHSVSGKPDKWTFEALIKVAHNTGKLPYVQEALSGLIRDWRNLVHPKKAVKDFQPQADLAPEVLVAVASVEKLLQALATLP